MPAGDFEGDEFEGEERGVQDHEHYVDRSKVRRVEECSSGSHRTSPEYEARVPQFPQVVQCAISMSELAYQYLISPGLHMSLCRPRFFRSQRNPENTMRILPPQRATS